MNKNRLWVDMLGLVFGWGGAAAGFEFSLTVG